MIYKNAYIKNKRRGACILERIINDSEKIRRAEEIYYRRNNKNINIQRNEDTKGKTYLGSKILLQFIILVNIAIVIFAIQNRNYIFTNEFLINLEKYNVNIGSKLNSFLKSFQSDNETVNSENNIVESEANQENNITNEANKDVTDEPNQTEEIVSNEENYSASSLSQMDLDVENLKNSYIFIKPVEGIKSSVFGARESIHQRIIGFHTGTDIAADKGTIIKSAFTGIVELVSSEGDYRKTCENQMQ